MNTPVINAQDSTSPRVSIELSTLGEELEMLVREDIHLRKIAGAAAVLISRLDGRSPPGIPEWRTTLLAWLIKEIPDDTMCEAMQLIKA